MPFPPVVPESVKVEGILLKLIVWLDGCMVPDTTWGYTVTVSKLVV